MVVNLKCEKRNIIDAERYKRMYNVNYSDFIPDNKLLYGSKETVDCNIEIKRVSCVPGRHYFEVLDFNDIVYLIDFKKTKKEHKKVFKDFIKPHLFV